MPLWQSRVWIGSAALQLLSCICLRSLVPANAVQDLQEAAVREVKEESPLRHSKRGYLIDGQAGGWYN